MKILIEESILRQALEFIDTLEFAESDNEQMAVMDALRSALDAAEKVEPVAWMCCDEELPRKGYERFSRAKQGDWNIPVFTHPALAVPSCISGLADIIKALVNERDGWKASAENRLEIQRQREAELAALRQICRDAYEVWAGSEGIPEPVTAPEAYLLQLLCQMRDEVKKGLTLK